MERVNSPDGSPAASSQQSRSPRHPETPSPPAPPAAPPTPPPPEIPEGIAPGADRTPRPVGHALPVPPVQLLLQAALGEIPPFPAEVLQQAGIQTPKGSGAAPAPIAARPPSKPATPTAAAPPDLPAPAPPTPAAAADDQRKLRYIARCEVRRISPHGCMQARRNRQERNPRQPRYAPGGARCRPTTNIHLRGRTSGRSSTRLARMSKVRAHQLLQQLHRHQHPPRDRR